MNTKNWEKTRAKGKKRFLWVNGFLGWGVTTAVLWSVMMEFIDPLDTAWVRPLIALVLFPIGGLFWGHFVWKSAEKNYLANKQS